MGKNLKFGVENFKNVNKFEIVDLKFNKVVFIPIV
jgi:hypothetical protein